MTSIAIENFIKTVYKQKESGKKKIPLVTIVQNTGLSKAAVSQMTKRLVEQGFVIYSRGNGISLSEKGEQLALQVVRRHRLWEYFLVKVLKYDWAEVHAEAERLEHHSSDELLHRMEAYLKYPKFDPHGYPIPNARGELPETPALIDLAKAKKHHPYTVARVDDSNDEMLRLFATLDIKPGKKLKILKQYVESTFKVSNEKGEHLLPAELAKTIKLYDL